MSLTRAPDAAGAASVRIGPLVRLLRPHHWVKNLLLLVPLLAAHRVDDPAAWVHALLGIAAMCCIAGAVYAVNDLLDVAADRAHPTKRYRPIAGGTVPTWAALAVALLAGSAGALLAFALPAAFQAWAATYLAVAMGYSLLLKRFPGVDVAVLALLYTLRVLLGAAAIGVPPSGWLLAFAGCLFLSLALLKRYVELVAAADLGMARLPGRGYRPSWRRTVFASGLGAGVLACIVLVFYADSLSVGAYYRTPGWLHGLAPLLLAWVVRAWLTARQRGMPADPIVYALRDPLSYAVVAGMATLTGLAV